MYRVGKPFWKLAARVGVPLLVKIEVTHDAEAGVYVATSPDLRGLIAEAPSKEALIRAVYDCTELLMEEALKSPLKSKPFAAWTGEVLTA